MVELVWLSIASEDLLSIVDFISDDNIIAAQTFQNEVETKVKQLIHFPKMGRLGRVKGTRELVLTPNYVIIYHETKSTIKILRVLHTARQWPIEQ